MTSAKEKIELELNSLIAEKAVELTNLKATKEASLETQSSDESEDEDVSRCYDENDCISRRSDYFISLFALLQGYTLSISNYRMIS